MLKCISKTLLRLSRFSFCFWRKVLDLMVSPVFIFVVTCSFTLNIDKAIKAMLKYRHDDIIIPFSLNYSAEDFRPLQPWWSLHWKYEQAASDDRNYIRIVHRTITSCPINTLTTIKIKRYFKIKRNTKKQWYVSMAFFICGKFGIPRNEN